LFGPQQVGDLLGTTEAEIPPQVSPDLARSADASAGGSNALAQLEFTQYLQNQLLKDADVMGMAHSLEIRVPYLDQALVEWVQAVPARLKRRGPAPKPLLVGALGADLPRTVWDRPKMGFTFPFATWLTARADEFEAMSLESKILRRSAVEEVWRAFRAGRLHWSRPWALVALTGFSRAGGRFAP
jgi:asparagine synthase (glutamine-hydrolysing)